MPHAPSCGPALGALLDWSFKNLVIFPSTLPYRAYVPLIANGRGQGRNFCARLATTSTAARQVEPLRQRASRCDLSRKLMCSRRACNAVHPSCDSTRPILPAMNVILLLSTLPNRTRAATDCTGSGRGRNFCARLVTTSTASSAIHNSFEFLFWSLNFLFARI